MQEANGHKEYFINLHCPYDIACIRCHNREYNFDNGGLLLWLLKEDQKIERSLNNRFVAKWDLGDDGIFENTRVLTEKEAEILYQTMSLDLSEILGILNSNIKSLEEYSVTSNAKEVLCFIEKAISHDYQKAMMDKKRFESIYGQIEIFPNDLPMPLIIQLTQGCAFYGKQKNTKDFKELKEKNIKRIYIGMESGSDKLLSFIKKCNTSEDIITLTNRIKEADIPVGIMLIAGLGGKRFYKEHIEKSISIINDLNLDRRDNIYFSHLFFHEKAPYKDDIQREGINSLSYEEENRQIQEITSGLNFAPLDFSGYKGI